MLHPDCQKFLRILSMGDQARAQPVSHLVQRESFQKLMALAAGPTPRNIALEDRQLDTAHGPLRLRLYRSDALMGKTLPTCVFLHGGGFIAGSIETHDGICRTLAEASGWQFISVNYRLAPEHRHPSQIEDALAVLDSLSEEPESYRAEPGRLAVAGDSVGGGLAARLAQEWSATSGLPLALQVLICPALDASPRFPSRDRLARGFYIEDHMIESDFAAYLGSGGRVPTVFDAGDLTGLPPALIHVAEFDPFRDEGIAYADALAAAGVEVKRMEHPGMLHLFHAFTRFIPAGADALRQIGDDMKAFA